MTPGCAASSYAALTLWYLGYPDQALKRSHEALTLAQELSHPFSLAVCPGAMLPRLHQLRREGQEAQERAEAADYTLYRARVSVLSWHGELSMRGWALAEQGQGEEGLPRYARAWLPPGHGGRVNGRIFLPCWPRRMGK